MPESTTKQESQKSLNRLRSEFENWLNMVVQQGEKALGAFGLNPQSAFQPDIDIVETSEAVCICIDIPGIDPETVDLSIAGSMLRVRGLRTSCNASRGEDARVHLQERLTGSFDRSIPMPCQVMADDISAEANHGVLTVKLPKPEPERPHEIKIKVNSEKKADPVETTVI